MFFAITALRYLVHSDVAMKTPKLRFRSPCFVSKRLAIACLALFLLPGISDAANRKEPISESEVIRLMTDLKRAVWLEQYTYAEQVFAKLKKDLSKDELMRLKSYIEPFVWASSSDPEMHKSALIVAKHRKDNPPPKPWIDPEARIILALMQIRNGQEETAMKLLESTPLYRKKQFWMYQLMREHLLAGIYARQKDWSAAYRSLNRGMQIHPHVADQTKYYVNNPGICNAFYYRVQQIQDAHLKEYDHATWLYKHYRLLKLKPNKTTKEKQETRRLFDSLLEQYPNSYWAGRGRFERGIGQWEEGDYSGAAGTWHTLYRLNPNGPFSGHARLAAGDYHLLMKLDIDRAKDSYESFFDTFDRDSDEFDKTWRDVEVDTARRLATLYHCVGELERSKKLVSRLAPKPEPKAKADGDGKDNDPLQPRLRLQKRSDSDSIQRGRSLLKLLNDDEVEVEDSILLGGGNIPDVFLPPTEEGSQFGADRRAAGESLSDLMEFAEFRPDPRAEKRQVKNIGQKLKGLTPDKTDEWQKPMSNLIADENNGLVPRLVAEKALVPPGLIDQLTDYLVDGPKKARTPVELRVVDSAKAAVMLTVANATDNKMEVLGIDFFHRVWQQRGTKATQSQRRYASIRYAQLLEKSGRLQGLEELYVKLMKDRSRPDLPDVYLAYGRLLATKLGNSLEAQKILARGAALQAASESVKAEADYLIAKCYMQQSEWTTAKRALEDCLHRHPDSRWEKEIKQDLLPIASNNGVHPNPNRQAEMIAAKLEAEKKQAVNQDVAGMDKVPKARAQAGKGNAAEVPMKPAAKAPSNAVARDLPNVDGFFGPRLKSPEELRKFRQKNMDAIKAAENPKREVAKPGSVFEIE